MAHTSEKRWEDINHSIGNISGEMLEVLMKGEETYQQLLELWAFAGGTDQAVADLLFNTTADATQVIMVSDAKAALTSIHELWQAANNVVVSQENRSDKLRRMT